MTPDRWSRDTAWKHGTPRRIVLSGERSDPSQLIEGNLPETAGDDGPPSRRRPVSLTDIAFLVSATAFLGALYMLADWIVKAR